MQHTWYISNHINFDVEISNSFCIMLNMRLPVSVDCSGSPLLMRPLHLNKELRRSRVSEKILHQLVDRGL